VARKRAPRLGADRAIPRRDFLQGALVGAGSVLAGPLLAPLAWADDPVAAAQDAAGYYPPLLHGLRGSQPGSFEGAHALRDGAPVPAARDTGEHYDLVVVGAGISGLSAAHFFQKRSAQPRRVLILDNHDDFGGHARRNEYVIDERTLLVNGGTLEIDSPRPYSKVAQGLLHELGVAPNKLARQVEHRDFYKKLGMQDAAFFDAQTFGADKLVVGVGKLPVPNLLKDSPLSERAREDIARIYAGSVDVYPGVSAAEKKLRMSKISYEDYLRDQLKCGPEALAYCRPLTHDWWGVGSDAVPALDAWGLELPGFQGMRLPHGSIPQMGNTPAGFQDTGGSERFHFPDGNASIARLLVRRLIPEVAAGTTAEDIVTTKFDYGKLDRPANPARLRLNSIVVRVKNLDAPGAGVELTYLRGGRAETVRASGCVLACYNMMIPYLCPELPAAQKAALHSLVKSPLVYTSVALRNWRPFKELGVSQIYAPGCYFTGLYLNAKEDIGEYHSPTDPDQPILLFVVRVPCKPGLTEYEQNKAGRADILATPFATFEHNLRDELQRILGPAGFDAAHDITAITVNRWPHGYAPEYNSLYDPDLPEAQRPHVIGRARFGRITIANSDAGAAAYTDSAIDQASRAVDELLHAG
jgi:spermidine dehydrogenase